MPSRPARARGWTTDTGVGHGKRGLAGGTRPAGDGGVRVGDRTCRTFVLWWTWSATSSSRAQRFVVGVVLRGTFQRKEETGAREPLLFVVLDELNKCAPREGRSPIKDILLDIAERGRSLGVILIGAQQAASEVGAVASPESEQVVYDALLRLARTGARVVVIAGNHDHPRRLAALGPLLKPANVTQAAFSSATQQSWGPAAHHPGGRNRVHRPLPLSVQARDRQGGGSDGRGPGRPPEGVRRPLPPDRGDPVRGVLGRHGQSRLGPPDRAGCGEGVAGSAPRTSSTTTSRRTSSPRRPTTWRSGTSTSRSRSGANVPYGTWARPCDGLRGNPRRTLRARST